MKTDDVIRLMEPGTCTTATDSTDPPTVDGLLRLMKQFPKAPPTPVVFARSGALQTVLDEAAVPLSPLFSVPVYEFTDAKSLLALFREFAGKRPVCVIEDDDNTGARVNAFLAVERWAAENGLPEPQMPEDW
jgi:hypothetical protein